MTTLSLAQQMGPIITAPPFQPKTDALIVIDIEATCWLGEPPAGERNEIIEVGVCLLDLTTLEVTPPRSILVRPIQSTISAFCTELTTLTQEQVDTGVLLGEACAILESEYDSRARAWGSWGAYDYKLFVSQCAADGVRYPFSPAHVNLKRVFGPAFGAKRGQQPGMANAMTLAGLTFEGTPHRGSDDAVNAARLMRAAIERAGIDTLLTRMQKPK